MTTDKQNAAPEAAGIATPRNNSNRAHDQRQRLLTRLRAESVDTVTARRELDILCPAARVLELRRRGYPIDTVWIERPTDCGKMHRVALYVLQAKGGKP